MNTPSDVSSRDLREAIHSKYAAIARGESSGDGCSGATSCCGSGETDPVVDLIGDAYGEVEGYVGDADLSLGCGIPTEHADLEAGQTVIDLGSGAGLDAFVARRIVGGSGHVIGVDFVSEMVKKARANAQKLGVDNVSFVEGNIEDLPLEACTADVVLSNCVFNLVPNKARAFAETYRVLRPGGHFCVSDIVSDEVLPEAIRRSAELYAGCIAGAVEESEYLDLIDATGFVDVVVTERDRIEVPSEVLPDTLSDAERNAATEGGLWSITVRGHHPKE